MSINKNLELKDVEDIIEQGLKNSTKLQESCNLYNLTKDDIGVWIISKDNDDPTCKKDEVMHDLGIYYKEAPILLQYNAKSGNLMSQIINLDRVDN